jgi:uncharacterized protein with HEPN domain
MEHNVRAYLYDIVTACRHVTSFTAEMTLEVHSSDIRTKAACERMFEIIGESLRRIKIDFPAIFSQIPDADQIIAFRNIIAHGYDVIEVQTASWSIQPPYVGPFGVSSPLAYPELRFYNDFPQASGTRSIIRIHLH